MKKKSRERECKRETESKKNKGKRKEKRKGLTSGDYSNRIMAQIENGECSLLPRPPHGSRLDD